MKKSNYRFTVLATFSFIACACLFAMSTWGQVKVEPSRQGQSQTPVKIGEKGVGGNPPDVRVADPFDSLKKRVDALETENQELKKQLSATKLLVTGLDKGIADFKKKFDTHTHSFTATTLPLSSLEYNMKSNKSLLDVVVINPISNGTFKTSLPTTP
jgi:hypothetical protein